MPLTLHLVVLETLRKEEDAFKSQNIFARISQIVAADFDFIFEFGSIFGVEWRLSVEKLEENNSNGPDVGFVRVMSLLHNLRSHIKRRSTNSLINLIQSLQLFRKAKVCNLDFKRRVH